MKEVAIFDLANKLISIPRIIFMKVNAAIFPKIMLNINGYSIKRIIKIETLVSFLPILIIIIFGRPVINLMSHGKLMDAYPLSIALSFSILTWIVVGAYINFIFVPKINTI
ncbi:hypothetical protein LDL59_03780 [Kaistella anthropi]|nr:hypothetical protein [Kaistella anthropi]